MIGCPDILQMDATDVFFAELDNCPTFSREEEAELVQRRDAGDADALDLLVRSVLPWTFSLASKKFKNDSEEAIWVASGAALRAARLLNPEKGRLTTYAYFAVRTEAQRHRLRFGSAITRPAYVPDNERLRECFDNAGRVISFSRQFQRDEDDSIGDTIVDDGQSPLDQAADNEEQRQRKEWVDWILRKMHPVYSSVLRQRMNDQALQDIGDGSSRSRERIRQLENRAQISFRRWADRFPLTSFIRRTKMNQPLTADSTPRLLDDVCAKKTLSECIEAITTAGSDEIAREEEILREEIEELKRQIGRRLDTIKLLNKFCAKKPAKKKEFLYVRIHSLLREKVRWKCRRSPTRSSLDSLLAGSQ